MLANTNPKSLFWSQHISAGSPCFTFVRLLFRRLTTYGRSDIDTLFNISLLPDYQFAYEPMKHCLLFFSVATVTKSLLRVLWALPGAAEHGGSHIPEQVSLERRAVPATS